MPCMPCFQYCVKSPKRHPFHTWSSPKKMGYHFQLPKWESNDTQPWFRPFWTSPSKYCMSESKFFPYSKHLQLHSLIYTWSTLKRCDETPHWTELATLGCTAANLSKANGWVLPPTPFGHSRCGMKQVPLFSCGAMWSKNHHFGDHDFWCRLQAIAQQNYIALTILGSWYWTDWTHNHKTLKEIIESHVCRCHMTLHLDFYDINFHGTFSGKLRTLAMRSNDAWATPAINTGETWQVATWSSQKGGQGGFGLLH